MPFSSTICVLTVVSFLYMSGLMACTISQPKDSPTISPAPPAVVSIDQQTEVERHFQKAIQEAEKLGPGNPFLLTNLYGLAAFYRDQGDVSKAEAVYQRALSLKETTSGSEHPDVALILDHYAMLLKRNDRQAEAISLEARAQAIRARIH